MQRALSHHVVDPSHIDQEPQQPSEPVQLQDFIQRQQQVVLQNMRHLVRQPQIHQGIPATDMADELEQQQPHVQQQQQQPSPYWFQQLQESSQLQIGRQLRQLQQPSMNVSALQDFIERQQQAVLQNARQLDQQNDRQQELIPQGIPAAGTACELGQPHAQSQQQPSHDWFQESAQHQHEELRPPPISPEAVVPQRLESAMLGSAPPTCRAAAMGQTPPTQVGRSQLQNAVGRLEHGSNDSQWWQFLRVFVSPQNSGGGGFVRLAPTRAPGE